MTGALCGDGLLPPARPGRRVADPFGKADGRDPPRCRRCPKWDRRTAVCLVRGCHQAPDAQACRYGAALMKGEHR